MGIGILFQSFGIKLQKNFIFFIWIVYLQKVWISLDFKKLWRKESLQKWCTFKGFVHMGLARCILLSFQVNEVWSGLGYYRRAASLHEGATMVMQEFNGNLPASHRDLLSIPGIGPYTAGAIASTWFLAHKRWQCSFTCLAFDNLFLAAIETAFIFFKKIMQFDVNFWNLCGMCTLKNALKICTMQWPRESLNAVPSLQDRPPKGLTNTYMHTRTRQNHKICQIKNTKLGGRGQKFETTTKVKIQS